MALDRTNMLLTLVIFVIVQLLDADKAVDIVFHYPEYDYNETNRNVRQFYSFHL